MMLTGTTCARVAVPVVAAVAVGGTRAGAAGVGHVAAHLHVDLPGLTQAQSATNAQTLHGDKRHFSNQGLH